MNSTIRRYQSVDLMIWSILLLVFEFIVVKAGSVWFRNQLWTLSIVPALVAIVYMRWGAFGIFYSALGGIALCFASGASTQQYLIYTLGNMFSIVLGKASLDTFLTVKVMNINVGSSPSISSILSKTFFNLW